MQCCRIGIFGGTFNPIHLAHLRVAEEVLETLNLDRVVFIPSFKPPHKNDESLAPYHDRFKMVELAIKGHPRFEISSVEAQLGGLSYTVRTLEYLEQSFPDKVSFFFLIGSDSLLEIESWYSYKTLFSMVSMVVMVRPGHSGEGVVDFVRSRIDRRYCWIEDQRRLDHSDLRSIYILYVTAMGISASRIRSLVKGGYSIRFLVPETVRYYIIDKKLYQEQ